MSRELFPKIKEGCVHLQNINITDIKRHSDNSVLYYNAVWQNNYELYVLRVQY